MKKRFLLILLAFAFIPVWVFQATAETPVTQCVAYQTTKVREDGSFDLRLVAILNDADYAQYESLGFDVTVSFDESTGIKDQTMTRTTQTVYRNLSGGDYTYSSADFNGQYFFALNCKGIYTDLGQLDFTVTTFSVKNGVRTDDSTLSFSYAENAEATTVSVPAFSNGTSSALYTIGNGAYEYSYSNVSSVDDYTSYLNLLETDNFVKYTENHLDGNLFATYTKSYMQVNVAYYPNISTLKLIWAPRGYLPALTAPVAGVDYQVCRTPTVTQLNRAGASESAAGESYVVQLEDGSFVVIDGGPQNANDQAALLHYLQSRMPSTHKKPQVTWMITHADYDHISLANAFIAAYHDLIDINTVCYNFPDFSTFGSDGTWNVSSRAQYVSTFESQIDQYYPQANVLIFHSGQTLYLPGCQIDFLLTHEDYYPSTFSSCNHTSSAWKMTFTQGTGSPDDDTSFMVLGDCEKGLCEQMATVYSSILQSDILQVSHHGLNGASLSLYQEIDPKICFWPIDESRFETDGRCWGLQATTDDNGYSYTVYADPNNKVKWGSYDFNYWLRIEDVEWNRGTDSGVREHYHAGQTVTIDMNTLTRQVVRVSETPFHGFDADTSQEFIWDWSQES